MGNGFPITAVLGKKKVMEHAQDTFISSTFWTERTGYAAALKVIEMFDKHNVSAHLVKTGEYLKNKLEDLFKRKNFKADVVGITPVPIIAINEENPMIVKTFFTQEMLKRGYLASNLTYLSYSHDKEIIDDFVMAAGEVIQQAVKGIREHRLKEVLEGPVCHSGFKRLT